MLQEPTATNTSTVDEPQSGSREDLGRALKASAPQHPALGRVHAKLVSASETEVAISRYDRMHHRHSRS
ncbi:MAG: hypothetical protein M3416_00585 [Acidobacteriota bacterium]|nr:hypothetical protein [Acidobacteriota bacterium]